MKKVKQFLINTIVLSSAALLMRTIGVSFSVYLSNKIGSQGIGLFELIMSVYTLAVAFAASGIKLSTTRLVVEKAECGGFSPRSVMGMCFRYSLVLGVSAALLLYLGADFIAARWLSNPDTALSLRVLSLSLPFISVSSCLNGYFTALRKVAPFAVIQVIEQLIRITLTVAALHFLLPRGLSFACVAMVIGSCLAEACSMLLSLCLYAFERKSPKGGRPSKLLRGLLSIAVPDAIGSWVRSALVTAKHLLIPRGLQKTGISPQAALATYGTVHGMALPVITFPSSFLQSLSGLLVPEISECLALGKAKRLQYMITRVLHMTLLFSIFVAGVLYCFSGELNSAIYDSAASAKYIRLLAPIIPIMYLDITVDGVLKGLGQQLYSMKYNIIDALMSLCMVWFLIPKMAVMGYIVTIFASEILNLYLSLRRLIKVTPLNLDILSSVIKPIIAIFIATVMARALFIIKAMPNLSSGMAIALTISAAFGFYLILLALLGAITRSDLHWLANIFKK